jgi:hypothetical protein
MPDLAIIYREFYDIPRMFIVSFRDRNWLFDGRFDDAADDYPEAYKIYSLPSLSHEILEGDWSSLPDHANAFAGTIPTANVQFDPSRRRTVSSGALEELLGAASANARRGVA